MSILAQMWKTTVLLKMKLILNIAWAGVKRRAQELPPESEQTGQGTGRGVRPLTVTPSGLQLPGVSALAISSAQHSHKR